MTTNLLNTGVEPASEKSSQTMQIVFHHLGMDLCQNT
jgi:hypothetical protein